MTERVEFMFIHFLKNIVNFGKNNVLKGKGVNLTAVLVGDFVGFFLVPFNILGAYASVMTLFVIIS